jgi:hypothetical protein
MERGYSMKDIKDYIHFYIGCKTNHGTLIGIDSGICMVRFECGYLSRGPINEIKPILRKLSSMTEEEQIEVDKRGSDGWQLINPHYDEKRQNIHLGVVHRQAAEVSYLLSRGFDLFGLIDANLAIDKDTI